MRACQVRIGPTASESVPKFEKRMAKCPAIATETTADKTAARHAFLDGCSADRKRANTNHRPNRPRPATHPNMLARAAAANSKAAPVMIIVLMARSRAARLFSQSTRLSEAQNGKSRKVAK